MKLGKSTLSKMMSTMPVAANLGAKYTNHSITVLDSVKFDARNIMAFSRHKSEASIRYSFRVRENKQRDMSRSLILACGINAYCVEKNKEHMHAINRDERHIESIDTSVATLEQPGSDVEGNRVLVEQQLVDQTPVSVVSNTKEVNQQVVLNPNAFHGMPGPSLLTAKCT